MHVQQYLAQGRRSFYVTPVLEQSWDPMTNNKLGHPQPVLRALPQSFPLSRF